MKICFFLGGFYQNGGIGRVTSILANRLAKETDIDVFALCYFNPHKQNIYFLHSAIHEEFLLDNYQSMAKLLLTAGERKLRKYLIDRDVDVLIACGALFFPISVRACKGIKTKCICWEHSDPQGNNDHKGQSFARKYGIKRSDLNIVLTKRALKVYQEKYKANNTIQVYNPIDPEVFRCAKGFNAESKKIISVGRLTYQKNFEAAVEVAANVLPQFPDWEWDVYGQGEDLDKLVTLTNKRGIEKQMHFMGQVSDLYNRYSDYSIMVMTSRYEGFPMTLLEGLGNGLPLISFDIPTGPDEIIDDGVNGFLLGSSDINGMTDKLLKVIGDLDLRIKLSRGSSTKARTFVEEEIIEEWIDIIMEISEK